jgi:hypothetical protein
VTASAIYGPVELRVRWEEDPEPYDVGDAEDHIETAHYVETYGVCGCVVEVRRPACACCGFKQWAHAVSLWSIVGDADYHREVERELISEATL